MLTQDSNQRKWKPRKDSQKGIAKQ